MECLKQYVGVTKSDCDCIISGLTTEEIELLRVSTSGMYLDDIPDALNFKVLKGIDACKDFYQKSIEARDTAINEFTADLIVAISNIFKKGARNYKGFLSKSHFTQSLNNVRQFQGIRMVGVERTDATVKITRMKIAGNLAGNMVLTIARTLQGENDWEILHELPFTTIANNFSIIAPPEGGLELPFGKNLFPYEYRFYYDRSTIPGFLPKDNNLGCGCKGSDMDLLDSYVDTSGISFVDQNSLQNYTSDNYAHGLAIDVEITCKTEVLICREVENTEEIALASKFAIAYKANQNLIERVLGSPEINRFTMMDRPHLYGKRNHFEKEYKDRILFIAGRVDISRSDCFNCRPNQMYMAKIQG